MWSSFAAQRSFPAVLAAGVTVLMFGLLNFVQLASGSIFYFVNPVGLWGVDYRDFFQASEKILQGYSPYLISRYVTTPVPATLNTALVPLGFETARTLVVLVSLGAVLVAYVMACRLAQPARSADEVVIRLSGVVILLLSYPVYFLFERGNSDGLVLFFLCLGVYFLPKRAWLGSLWLALALTFKLYPLLIILPLIMRRRWRALLLLGLWVGLLVLLTWSQWSGFGAVLAQRSSDFLFFENGSLANTLRGVANLLTHLSHLWGAAWSFTDLIPVMTLAVYGVLLGIVLLAQYRQRFNPDDFAVEALLYVPYMVALPLLVFQYEFVVLIAVLPVICYWWYKPQTRAQRGMLVLAAIGIALSQAQAVAMAAVTVSHLPYYLPGLGLVLVLLGISGYQLLALRPSLPRPHVAA